MDASQLVRLSQHPAAHIAANLYQYRRPIGYAINAVGGISMVTTRAMRRRSLRGGARRTSTGQYRGGYGRRAMSYSRRSSFRRQTRRRTSNIQQRRKRRQNFYKVGSPYVKPAQVRQTLVKTDILKTRELKEYNLTEIPFGQDNEMNERKTTTIWVKGISLTMQIKNKIKDVILFNYALVTPFDENVSFEQNFFKSAVQQRGVDFTTNLRSTAIHQRAINTDRFHVFTHKRMQLESEGGGTNDINIYGPRNWRLIQRYIPIKRMFRFENNTQNMPLTNVFLIYWCDRLCNPTNAAQENTAVQMEVNCLTYFRNII